MEIMSWSWPQLCLRAAGRAK